MALSNRDIISRADILMSHTAGFNLPAAFANRDDSRAFLGGTLKRPGPSLTLVSDLLGSGKTFLVETVLANSGMTDVQLLLCGKNKAPVMKKAAEKGPVFVDEWDIKASPRDFERAIEGIGEFIRISERPVVLLGDYTLKNSFLCRRFGDLGLAPTVVPMEPLDPAFFRMAWRQRVWYAFKDRYGEGSTAAVVPDADIAVFDDMLLRALVPDWPITSATFRDTFRTLAQITANIKANDAPARIGGGDVDRWVAANAPQGMSPPQKALLGGVVETLRPLVRDGAALQPWSMSALQNMAGEAAANLTDIAFQDEVVVPLARQGLLSALGIPEIRETSYDRYPGPYLPGCYTRLAAALGQG